MSISSRQLKLMDTIGEGVFMHMSCCVPGTLFHGGVNSGTSDKGQTKMHHLDILCVN